MTSFPQKHLRIVTALMATAVVSLFLTYLVTTVKQQMGSDSTMQAQSQTTSAPTGGSAMPGSNLPENVASELSQLMASLQEQPDNFETLLRIATIFMDAKEWKRASTFLDKAILAQPSAQQPRAMMGVCLFQLGEYQNAATTFESLLKQSDDLTVRFNLAILYKHYLNATEKATPLFQEIINDPKTQEAMRHAAKKEIE